MRARYFGVHLRAAAIMAGRNRDRYANDAVRVGEDSVAAVGDKTAVLIHPRPGLLPRDEGTEQEVPYAMLPYKLAATLGKSADAEVATSAGDYVAITSDARYSGQQVEGNYPKVEAYFSTERQPVATMRLSTPLLAQILRAAACYGKDTTLQFAYHGEDRPVLVTLGDGSHNHANVEALAKDVTFALMPVAVK